jgi:hypothetical protein
MTLPLLLSLADILFSGVDFSSDLPRGSSPSSSNSVAPVAYEPCAEEVRLSGGDGMLSSETALLPSPLRRLGVFEYDLDELTRFPCRTGALLCVLSREALRPPEDSRGDAPESMGEAVAEAGLELWLFILGVGRLFGGCGKDPMLMVFLSALAGFVAGEMALAGFGAGKPEAEAFCGFDWPAGSRDGSADDVERVEVCGPGRSELLEPLRE